MVLGIHRGVLGIVLCLSLMACSRSDPADQVIEIDENDAQMNTAIAAARASLPEFWKHLDNPQPGENDFALKTKITDPNGTEHFWVISITKSDGKVFGEIPDEPKVVKSVKNGQRVEVPEASISDWMFMRNKKIVGNYTLRPLLKNMPQDQADELRAMLETP